MWIKKIAVMGFILLTQAVFANVITKDADIKFEVQKSLKTYSVCNIAQLAQELSNQFVVYSMSDSLAKYNYFLIKNNEDVNADKIRGISCAFIKKNNCYLFWGNVANLALISTQKAAWFPADTSPHYMLSPIITCDKLK
jgi:hypothetical protein